MAKKTPTAVTLTFHVLVLEEKINKQTCPRSAAVRTRKTQEQSHFLAKDRFSEKEVYKIL